MTASAKLIHTRATGTTKRFFGNTLIDFAAQGRYIVDY